MSTRITRLASKVSSLVGAVVLCSGLITAVGLGSVAPQAVAEEAAAQPAAEAPASAPTPDPSLRVNYHGSVNYLSMTTVADGTHEPTCRKGIDSKEEKEKNCYTPKAGENETTLKSRQTFLQSKYVPSGVPVDDYIDDGIVATGDTVTFKVNIDMTAGPQRTVKLYIDGSSAKNLDINEFKTLKFASDAIEAPTWEIRRDSAGNATLAVLTMRVKAGAVARLESTVPIHALSNFVGNQSDTNFYNVSLYECRLDETGCAGDPLNDKDARDHWFRTTLGDVARETTSVNVIQYTMGDLTVDSDKTKPNYEEIEDKGQSIDRYFNLVPRNLTPIGFANFGLTANATHWSTRVNLHDFPAGTTFYLERNHVKEQDPTPQKLPDGVEQLFPVQEDGVLFIRNITAQGRARLWFRIPGNTLKLNRIEGKIELKPGAQNFNSGGNVSNVDDPGLDEPLTYPTSGQEVTIEGAKSPNPTDAVSGFNVPNNNWGQWTIQGTQGGLAHSQLYAPYADRESTIYEKPNVCWPFSGSNTKAGICGSERVAGGPQTLDSYQVRAVDRDGWPVAVQTQMYDRVNMQLPEDLKQLKIIHDVNDTGTVIDGRELTTQLNYDADHANNHLRIVNSGGTISWTGLRDEHYTVKFGKRGNSGTCDLSDPVIASEGGTPSDKARCMAIELTDAGLKEIKKLEGDARQLRVYIPVVAPSHTSHENDPSNKTKDLFGTSTQIFTSDSGDATYKLASDGNLNTTPIPNPNLTITGTGIALSGIEQVTNWRATPKVLSSPSSRYASYSVTLWLASSNLKQSGTPDDPAFQLTKPNGWTWDGTYKNPDPQCSPQGEVPEVCAIKGFKAVVLTFSNPSDHRLILSGGENGELPSFAFSARTVTRVQAGPGETAAKATIGGDFTVEWVDPSQKRNETVDPPVTCDGDNCSRTAKVVTSQQSLISGENLYSRIQPDPPRVELGDLLTWTADTQVSNSEADANSWQQILYFPGNGIGETLKNPVDANCTATPLSDVEGAAREADYWDEINRYNKVGPDTKGVNIDNCSGADQNNIYQYPLGRSTFDGTYALSGIELSDVTIPEGETPKISFCYAEEIGAWKRNLEGDSGDQGDCTEVFEPKSTIWSFANGRYTLTPEAINEINRNSTSDKRIVGFKISGGFPTTTVNNRRSYQAGGAHITFSLKPQDNKVDNVYMGWMGRVGALGKNNLPVGKSMIAWPAPIEVLDTSLSGIVYNDADYSGALSPDEARFGGVTVSLFCRGSGVGDSKCQRLQTEPESERFIPTGSKKNQVNTYALEGEGDGWRFVGATTTSAATDENAVRQGGTYLFEGLSSAPEYAIVITHVHRRPVSSPTLSDPDRAYLNVSSIDNNKDGDLDFSRKNRFKVDRTVQQTQSYQDTFADAQSLTTVKNLTVGAAVSDVNFGYAYPTDDMAVDKSKATVTPVNDGSQYRVDWDVTVRNTGNSPLKDVQLDDRTSADISDLGITASPGRFLPTTSSNVLMAGWRPDRRGALIATDAGVWLSRGTRDRENRHDSSWWSGTMMPYVKVTPANQGEEIVGTPQFVRGREPNNFAIVGTNQGYWFIGHDGRSQKLQGVSGRTVGTHDDGFSTITAGDTEDVSKAWNRTFIATNLGVWYVAVSDDGNRVTVNQVVDNTGEALTGVTDISGNALSGQYYAIASGTLYRLSTRQQNPAQAVQMNVTDGASTLDQPLLKLSYNGTEAYTSRTEEFTNINGVGGGTPGSSNDPASQPPSSSIFTHIGTVLNVVTTYGVVFRQVATSEQCPAGMNTSACFGFAGANGTLPVQRIGVMQYGNGDSIAFADADRPDMSILVKSDRGVWVNTNVAGGNTMFKYRDPVNTTLFKLAGIDGKVERMAGTGGAVHGTFLFTDTGNVYLAGVDGSVVSGDTTQIRKVTDLFDLKTRELIDGTTGARTDDLKNDDDSATVKIGGAAINAAAVVPANTSITGLAVIATTDGIYGVSREGSRWVVKVSQDIGRPIAIAGGGYGLNENYPGGDFALLTTKGLYWVENSRKSLAQWWANPTYSYRAPSADYYPNDPNTGVHLVRPAGGQQEIGQAAPTPLNEGVSVESSSATEENSEGDEFTHSTRAYKGSVLYPGQSLVFHVTGVVQNKNEAYVVANQAWAQSERTPRSGLDNVTGDRLAPGVPDVPVPPTVEEMTEESDRNTAKYYLDGFESSTVRLNSISDGVISEADPNADHTALVNVARADDLADQTPALIPGDEYNRYLAGQAWYDLNGDGLLNNNEKPVVDMTVDAWYRDSGTGLTHHVDPVRTNAEGKWELHGLRAKDSAGQEIKYDIFYNVTGWTYEGKLWTPTLRGAELTGGATINSDVDDTGKTDGATPYQSLEEAQAGHLVDAGLKTPADPSLSVIKGTPDQAAADTQQTPHGVGEPVEIRGDRLLTETAPEVPQTVLTPTPQPADGTGPVSIEDGDGDPRTAAYTFQVRNDGNRSLGEISVSDKTTQGEASMLQSLAWFHPMNDFGIPEQPPTQVSDKRPTVYTQAFTARWVQLVTAPGGTYQIREIDSGNLTVIDPGWQITGIVKIRFAKGKSVHRDTLSTTAYSGTVGRDVGASPESTTVSFNKDAQATPLTQSDTFEARYQADAYVHLFKLDGNDRSTALSGVKFSIYKTTMQNLPESAPSSIPQDAVELPTVETSGGELRWSTDTASLPSRVLDSGVYLIREESIGRADYVTPSQKIWAFKISADSDGNPQISTQDWSNGHYLTLSSESSNKNNDLYDLTQEVDDTSHIYLVAYNYPVLKSMPITGGRLFWLLFGLVGTLAIGSALATRFYRGKSVTQ